MPKGHSGCVVNLFIIKRCASEKRLLSGPESAKCLKNTLGSTYSRKQKAGPKPKPKNVFDFSNNTGVSSILGELEEEEEPYETFDPPLHSTAIYAEDELSKSCVSSTSPATHRGKESRHLNSSENEASGSEPIKLSRKKKTRKKVRLSPGRRKRPRCGATDSDASESMRIWCLEGRRPSDIMELDVILSEFEEIFLEYKQRVESESCNQAINKFYFKIKEELIRTLKEVQMLKALQRKNAKVISDMEKKRWRLLEVQDELIRLEPQLKQLQTKYDDLKERKSSLKNSKHFLTNLKQLYQDYSNVQEKVPKENEKYDSSSLPALLFKARSILGAENHLKTINYQLGKLLEQD
ncbi:centromere protein U isoform X3 [Mastomys coucha]|uniref:centromere protein U isoform X3 n=1 Tax=Mastomys coucha TaxID=35658 RepID=UPI0012628D45|nr:centromere protein U isoform X3 [Mastomys coucha]